MFAWSLIILIENIIYVLSLYFVYVFLEKKDVGLRLKLIWALFLLPIILLLPTKFNLLYFDATNCYREVAEGSIATYYTYFLEIFFAIWIIVIGFLKYRKSEIVFKRQIFWFIAGVLIFLLAFSSGNVIGSFTENWTLAQYGLFGMPVFMAFLAVLIIKYQAFNIKLLTAQALVAALVILVGSQFFFIRSTTNRILTGIGLVLISLFGWWLVRSVKKENQRNEELSRMNKELNENKRQLEQANRELKKLESAKTEFINIASHQLRTPVTVIKGVISLMISGDMDKFTSEKRKEFYQAAWIKCRKLGSIIDDILNANALTSHKYTVRDKMAEPINLGEFFTKIIKGFEPEVRERKLELVLENVDKSVPNIYGQKDYLEEAFSNIINNAVKYTPSPEMTNDVRKKRAGKGIIRVSVERDRENKAWIMVKVKDNGIGIPKKEMPKIFKKFSRATNAKNMYTDGSGLGLFIVKEIITGHGGRVWVESVEGRGSTFFVKLPVRPGQDPNIRKYIIEKSG
ncbi:hypothetical protein KJ912_02535 [Patescibacteria group bacterium]|nr:hypothetical protein [Patescibacteria group bacterium]